MKQMKTTTLG